VLVTDASESEARTVRAAGISAQVPRGWHQRSPDDPIQLSVYTDAWFVGENCDAKTDYTTINVGVTSDPGRGATPIPAQRVSIPPKGPEFRPAKTTPTSSAG
jgi:hypothetical protein